jgi:HK97 family phage major capsid protein
MVEKLKEKRTALIEEMDNLIEGKEKLTDEERALFDAKEKELETLEKDLDRAVKNEKRKEAIALDKAAEEAMKKATIPVHSTQELSKDDKKIFRKYSIAKAISDYGSREGKLDGIEAEMHQEAKREMQEAGGLSLHGLGVPMVALRADLKATVDASGGYTVATDLVEFIPTLRNNMVSLQAGAKLWTGLKGDVALPRRATDSTATWRTEGGVATQSDPTYEQVTMTPHRLTNYTEFTHQLLKQSTIDVENEVRNTLFYGIANALETAVYAGSGTSQVPAGLINTTGVNDADHGSNGTVTSWANIVQMETMVAEDNGLMGKLAYITNSTIAGLFKTTLKDTYQGGYLWEQFTPVSPKGMINGYDAYVTNAISKVTTRGTNTACSLLFFGDWSQLYVGQWGSGLDLLINPYSLDTYGTIRVVAAGYYDIAVKQPKAFAAMAGIENDG